MLSSDNSTSSILGSRSFHGVPACDTIAVVPFRVIRCSGSMNWDVGYASGVSDVALAYSLSKIGGTYSSSDIGRINVGSAGAGSQIGS